MSLYGDLDINGQIEQGWSKPKAPSKLDNEQSKPSPSGFVPTKLATTKQKVSSEKVALSFKPRQTSTIPPKSQSTPKSGIAATPVISYEITPSKADTLPDANHTHELDKVVENDIPTSVIEAKENQPIIDDNIEFQFDDTDISFDIPDAYDPMKPNDYLNYCEERLLQKKQAKLEEDNIKKLQQLEQERIQKEKERLIAIESGDIQTLQKQMSGGRGRGGVSNLPAWMTKNAISTTTTTTAAANTTITTTSAKSNNESKYTSQPGQFNDLSTKSSPILSRQSSTEQYTSSHSNTNNISSIGGIKRKLGGLLSNPTCVLLLLNMTDPDDVDDDLEGEISQECCKYGSVKSCYIYITPMTSTSSSSSSTYHRHDEVKYNIRNTNNSSSIIIPKEERVRIFIEFDRQDSCIKAYREMNGRYFGGRQIQAQYYDEEQYHHKVYTSAVVK